MWELLESQGFIRDFSFLCVKDQFQNLVHFRSFKIITHGHHVEDHYLGQTCRMKMVKLGSRMFKCFENLELYSWWAAPPLGHLCDPGTALSLSYLMVLPLSLTRQWASWDQNPHLNYFYSSSTCKAWHTEGSKSVWWMSTYSMIYKWKLNGLDFLTIGSYYFFVLPPS